MDGSTNDAATRLLETLRGMDLTSADGRAGLGRILAEIERAAPGAILKQAAGIDLRRLGWSGRSGSEPLRREGQRPRHDAA